MSELTTTLAALAEINPKTSIPLGKTVSFVGMEDVSESFHLIATHDRSSKELGTGYTRFREGDLLFAKITPCMENGKGARADGLTNGLGMGSTEFHVLRPRVPESRPFIAQWLASSALRRAAEGYMTGSAGQRRVPSDFFAEFEVPNLSIPEQQAVGSILDALDARIGATEQIVIKLEVLKVALYQELFAGIDGLLLPLGDVAEVRNGSTPSRARRDYWERGSIAWLASGKVNDYRITTPSELVTQRAVSECHLRILPAGSVLVGMIGQGKTRGMAARLDIAAAINQNLAGIVPGPRLLGGYLQHYLVHSYQKLRSGGRGSNQDALTTGLVAGFQVPVPPIEEQRRVANLLDALDLRIKAEREVVAKLTAEKDGLIADLLTGRVRVPAKVAS